MKIENQCCTLLQAKRLEELGVAQESIFYWHQRMDEWKVEHEGEYNRWAFNAEIPFIKDEEHFSAFTVAELGVLLGSGDLPFFDKSQDAWITIQSETSKGLGSMNEAIIRSERLIYKLERNLIKVDEVNKRLLSV